MINNIINNVNRKIIIKIIKNNINDPREWLRDVQPIVSGAGLQIHYSTRPKKKISVFN